MSSLYQTGGRKAKAEYLSENELGLQQRLLAQVQSFPQEFWSAIINKVALDGLLIPRSQIQGWSQFSANAAQVTTGESTASTSYTNLATVGPELTGLSSGTYLILFGALVHATANAWTGACSVSINGAAAVDADGFAAGWVVSEGAAVENLSIPSMRAVVKTLDESNNTVTMKYRLVADSAPTFENRWLVALKVSN